MLVEEKNVKHGLGITHFGPQVVSYKIHFLLYRDLDSDISLRDGEATWGEKVFVVAQRREGCRKTNVNEEKRVEKYRYFVMGIEWEGA